MSDDLFLRYGRAAYEAKWWAEEFQRLSLEIDALGEQVEHSPDVEVTKRKIPAAPARPSAVRKCDVPFSDDVRAQFGLYGRYFGVCRRVAKRLDVNPSHAVQVASGGRTSARVLAAIVEEMHLVDEHLKANPPDVFTPEELTPLSAAQRAQFRYGGRYYGLMRVVAKKAGTFQPEVSRVANGHRATPRTLAVLHREMARVDAELVARTAGHL